MLTEQRLNQMYDELRQELQQLLQARDQDVAVVKQIALVQATMQQIHKLKTYMAKL